MLQTWEDQANPRAARVAEPFEFVVLPVEPAPALPSTGPLMLELTQANGDHWSLQGWRHSRLAPSPPDRAAGAAPTTAKRPHRYTPAGMAPGVG